MSFFPTKILLAIDGSEEAALATEAATELSKNTASEVHLAYVVPTPARLAYPHHYPAEVRDDLGVGLIVIGSRGLTGMRRALMGSTSDSVVRHAHCPVLVVRREERQVEST